MQAGIRLLVEQPEKLLDGGLRSEDAINIANSSHATFYRKFSTKSRYLAEVLDQLADDAPGAPSDLRALTRSALDAHGGDRRRAVRALILTHFDAAFNDAFTTRRLLAMAFGSSSRRTPGTMRATYRRSDALILQIFEVLFAHTGATFRKPLTANSFCVVLTALLDGFLIRHRAEPQAVSAELVADAVLAVLNAAVDSSQSHSHIDDALTALGTTPGRPSVLPSEPRAALLEAARSEFTKRGYFMTTIAAIAADARVPLDAARRIFPTKAHLIIGALKSAHATLGEGIADDTALGHDDVTIVRNHYLRCARLVDEERPFMDALMAAVAHDTYAEPDGLISIKRELNFPALLAPVIQHGQDSGVFADDRPAVEIAAFLTNTLLLRCFTSRNLSPEQNAAFVSSVTFDGLRIP
ncbi:TetR family transcriptional regulator [Nocardia sp. NPDC051052]|uniref:TetR family transcriptional regulator n=1 Tax=Nocardia sp. NPDC051052 TaxID=3364322 RepID=UPI0037A84A5A